MADNTLAYGFIGMSRISGQRVSEVGVERVFDMVRATMVEHNRGINVLLSSWAQQTVTAKEQIELPGGGTLQPIDEWGNPRPVIQEGNYNVAYPIQGAGTAWGDNRISAALLTVEEANRRTIEAMRMDADWLRRHLMAAVFTNTTWSYTDIAGPNGAAGLGAITIQPLANNDTVVYLRTGGSTAIDTHYLAQAAAIDDSNNPFDDIYTELIEHPSNSGPVVVYIPTNLKASVQALTNFTQIYDPDIALGVNTDRIASPINMGLGDEVLGKTDKCWIVEWKFLPDSYMVAHAQGAGPFLKRREYDAPEVQGLFSELHSPDGNTKIVRMLRYTGFGAFKRVAALVYRIGNGSYAIPSGYTAPLSV